ncbi:hypothetical protein ADUPG1_006970 [Aduncisulcus paluster]|uniref:Uncharacterized protein n=1 Tax=Aduncisulcus paluster TaxID=2918883 RepID=A0ABQ5KK98_9EUKA|nr:hypothetical protein ADUPG1_006970 [Aduncisulcus paluster]
MEKSHEELEHDKDPKLTIDSLLSELTDALAEVGLGGRVERMIQSNPECIKDESPIWRSIYKDMDEDVKKQFQKEYSELWELFQTIHPIQKKE